jgi:hypothetical protein
MENKVYETLGQCSADTGVSVDKLSIAKNVLAAPGFRGARVEWHIFKPWLDDNHENLDFAATQDISELKRQKLIKENTLKDLEIAEKRGEVINPKDVIGFLQGLGKAISAVQNSKEKEIKSKVDAGTSKLIAKAFSEIRDIYRNELAEWMETHKLNS